MVLSRVRLFDDSVSTSKIAPDTVIPADIDETQDFNFSSTSGTFAGALTQIQSGVVNDLQAGSTAVTFARAFSAIPVITATRVGTSSSTALSVNSASTLGFNLVAGVAGTANWIAHRNL